MKFVKMHGIGNDYVYLDAYSDPSLERRSDLPRLARAMSERHTGIGADGLILVCRPSDRDSAVRMRMFNADGSESEMCGNGIRCVAKFAYERLGIRQSPLQVQTGRGGLAIDCDIRDGKVVAATVDMGEPIFGADEIPVELPRPTPDGRIVDFPLSKYIALPGPNTWMEACGLDPRMTCLSMGNPHLVLFCGQVDAVPLESIGPVLEEAPIFPNRTNVHFVQINGESEATMRTWERGAGATMACGTGACAALVAGALTGRLKRKALLHLPGGDLGIAWDEKSGHVFKTGPATDVFVGDWPG